MEIELLRILMGHKIQILFLESIVISNNEFNLKKYIFTKKP